MILDPYFQLTMIALWARLVPPPKMVYKGLYPDDNIEMIFRNDSGPIFSIDYDCAVWLPPPSLGN